MAIISDFPFTDWRDVQKPYWLNKVIVWFKENYPKAAYYTMSALLDYVFEVLEKSAQNQFVNFQDKIGTLGAQLLEFIPDKVREDDLHFGRDKRILFLMKSGLHKSHPHFFVVAKLSKNNLLNSNEYSALALAVKYHASGRFDEAIAISNKLDAPCPLAKYIVSQSYRQKGNYQHAHGYLEESFPKLANWSEHQCPYNKNFQVICDGNLLTVESYRGKAVLYRKQNKVEDAKKYFDLAQGHVEASLPNGVVPTTDTQNNDALTHQLYHVAADVYFGYGYFLYSRDELQPAAALFQKAIDVLEQSNEIWDSPYTRLAVIRFIEGFDEDSKAFFSQAYRECQRTAPETNRDAPLSQALCSLGLKLLGDEAEKPFDLLEKTLNDKDLVKLSLGPLECHRDDATKFLARPNLTHDQTKTINTFIGILNAAILDIHAPRKHRSKDRKKEDRYCFISYSHADKPLVDTVEKCLKDMGIKCWRDTEIKPSDVWISTLQEKIKNCDYFILMASENSSKSLYVTSEINYAVDCNIPMLSIRLDDSILPLVVNIYQAVNFDRDNCTNLESLRNVIKLGDSS